LTLAPCNTSQTLAASARRVAILRVGSIMRARLNNKQAALQAGLEGEKSMADSVYKIIELVGTSTESWEKAAGASGYAGCQDLARSAHRRGVQLDMQVQNGKVKAYRAKVKVSFKFRRQEVAPRFSGAGIPSARLPGVRRAAVRARQQARGGRELAAGSSRRS